MIDACTKSFEKRVFVFETCTNVLGNWAKLICYSVLAIEKHCKERISKAISTVTHCCPHIIFFPINYVVITRSFLVITTYFSRNNDMCRYNRYMVGLR